MIKPFGAGFSKDTVGVNKLVRTIHFQAETKLPQYVVYKNLVKAQRNAPL